MRNKTSSSLQKTYDECYLICSTAVYFEGQVSIDVLLEAPEEILDRERKVTDCANLDRVMKRKHCDHGVQLLTKYTITMHIAYPQATCQNQRRKRH